jgi:ubiquinone/menaquinone biosynthesis C-methylase UbiE
MTDRPPVCDYEGSDYQTTFWDTGERAYEDGAEAVALQAMLPARGRLMLEVGAGAGRNTPRYAGFERVVLLDYSRTQLAQAQARLGRDDRYVFVAADVYRLPFAAGVFDGATMIRVLHHMTDGQAALAQIKQVLAPGATFILEFANKQNLKAIARWALRRQTWSPFTPEPVEFVKLNFDFHPETTFGWLRQLGFQISEVRAVSYLRVPALKRLVSPRVLVGIDSVLQATGGLAQFSPSVFVRAVALGGVRAQPTGLAWRCPACASPDLHDQPDQLVCTQCGARWPKQDGIYDFRKPLG